LKILAIDLGASSGRAILGKLSANKKLSLEEIYRFSNEGIHVNNDLIWDVPHLFNEIKNALTTYVKKYGGSDLNSIGVDTWGVNFILLDKDDKFLSPMYHYRDERTVGMLEKMFNIVPKEEIFKQTGIQFLELNSSTQLFSMIYNKSPRLPMTKTIIMFPDYINYLLSAYDLIKNLGLNPEWFIKVIPGGTILGSIKKDVADEVGLNYDTKIIAPLTHDTGSAYASVPVDMNKYFEGEYGILSSGTWSIIGVELKEPLINDKALEYNYSNEGGINGTIRFLKNITGLWLIQECKKIWDRENMSLSWDKIAIEAEKADPFQSFINPDDHSFLAPLNMVQAIQNFCKTTDQNVPETIGEISRTIFESITFSYKQAVENLENIIGKKLKILYIIGGGSHYNLLNQFTANVLNIPIKAGPSEATIIGNILVQALALGEVKDLIELREIVRNSFKIKNFLPENHEKWEEAYFTFLGKTKKK